MVRELGTRQFVWVPLLLGALQLLILEHGIVEGRVFAPGTTFAEVDRVILPSAIEQAFMFGFVTFLVGILIAVNRRAGLIPQAAYHPYDSTLGLTLAFSGVYFGIVKIVMLTAVVLVDKVLEEEVGRTPSAI